MEITHLVTVGCSWTYCQGLDDPKTQGWPALLANKLGVPVVNLAVPGSGNDTTYRRTYEYFFDDSPNNNKPLYVIGWTQTWRREAWCRKYYHKHLPQGYASIGFPNSKPNNFYEAAILDNWSEEDFLRRTMLCQLSVDSLFKSMNIPYVASFMTDFNNAETPPIIEKYSNQVEHIQHQTNTIDPIYKLTAHLSKLPCGHEGLEAMEVTASYLYEQLIKKYNIINPVSGKYLSLAEFNSKDITGMVMNSAWE